MRLRSRWLWAGLAAGVLFVHRPVLQGKVMAGRDAFRLFIPDSVFLLESLRQGELPLWNPYLRLGQPSAASLHSEAFYPPHLLTTLAFGPYVGFTVHHALHVAAAAIGAFLLARRLRASRAGAALSSAAFALSPMLADLHGQRNVVDAACWTPFLILAVLGVAKRPGLTSAAWLAVTVAGSFLCGSPETLLWQILLGAAVLLAAAKDRTRGTAVALGAGAWGAALAGIALVPGVEYALHSTRGQLQDSLDWSTSWAQLASMVLPFADQPRDQYWGGDQWFVLTIFAGAVTCALAAMAVARVGRRRSRVVRPFAAAPGHALASDGDTPHRPGLVWPFAAVAVVLALLALGRYFPPAGWVLQLPPFSLFRYPAKYLVGALFCVALLSGLGLDRTVALLRRRRPSWRAVAIALGTTAVALGIALAVGRAGAFRPGFAPGALWAVLAVGLTASLALGLPRKRRRTAVAACAFIELGAYHLLAIGAGWTQPAKLATPSALAAAIPRPFDGRISIDAYRPDDLTPKARPQLELSRDALWANRFVEERLPALEGYGAPEPKRIEEFHLSQERSIFDLAGVRYYVRRGPPPFPDLTLVAGGNELPSLYRSDTALPRVFVAQEALVLPERAILERLARQPAARVAMLSEGSGIRDTGCADSSARITRATHNSLEVDAVACQPSYLVVADSWFPGWSAEVDGREAKVLRANYALRAIPLDTAGAHRVVLEYRPASFTIGAAMSAAAVVALALALGTWRTRRRRA